MTCKQCGRDVPDHAVYCRYCGARCADEEKTPAPIRRRRSRLPAVIAAALILALLAGLFFYLRGRSLRGSESEPVPQDSAVAEPSTSETPEEPNTPDVPVEYTLHIEGDDNIIAGKDVILTAVVTPDTAVKRTVWTSSDESVATVVDGIVTGEAEGETLIRCLVSLDSGPVLEATLPFRVLPKPVTYTARLEPASLELAAGSAGTFSVVVTSDPESEEVTPEITWESTDTLVAAVTDGRVQAVGEGSARINARVKLPDGTLQTLTGSVKVTPAASAPAPAAPAAPKPAPAPAPEPAPAPAPAQEPEQPSTPKFEPAGVAPERTGDYMAANSGTEYLSMDALLKMSDEDLSLTRNEIFARYGRKFNTQWIREYFESKSWYQGTIDPDDFDPNVLNDIEHENVSRLVYAEAHN